MNYDGMILCAHASTEAFLEGGQRPPAWPLDMRDKDGVTIVRWRVRKKLPKFDADDYRKIVSESLGRWSAVCGVEFIEDDASGYGGIEFDLHPQPSPGGVLADCMLPNATTRPSDWMHLRMDHSEAWVAVNNPESNVVDVLRVICHEAGHGLGISHISEGNLMAPVYSRKIGWPQAGDIWQATARYGEPRSKRIPPQKPRTDRAFVDVCQMIRDGWHLVLRNGKDGSEVIL